VSVFPVLVSCWCRVLGCWLRRERCARSLHENKQLLQMDPRPNLFNLAFFFFFSLPGLFLIERKYLEVSFFFLLLLLYNLSKYFVILLLFLYVLGCFFVAFICYASVFLLVFFPFLAFFLVSFFYQVNNRLTVLKMKRLHD